MLFNFEGPSRPTVGVPWQRTESQHASQPQASDDGKADHLGYSIEIRQSAKLYFGISETAYSY